MWHVVMRPLPWRTTRRGPGWKQMRGPDFQTVHPACRGARPDRHRHLRLCSEDARRRQRVLDGACLPPRSGCGPHQRACAWRPLEVWSTSAQRGWIAVSQDFIPG